MLKLESFKEEKCIFNVEDKCKTVEIKAIETIEKKNFLFFIFDKKFPKIIIEEILITSLND
jgi:hypothetical protein